MIVDLLAGNAGAIMASGAVIGWIRVCSGRAAGVRVRRRRPLLFLSSELVEPRLDRGEVSDCWGHDKPYLALAVRYAVMFRPWTAKSSRRALSNLSSIKISSCLPAETKAATASSDLPRNGAAVERAEHKGLAQARIEFQADERCAVELLSSMVTGAVANPGSLSHDGAILGRRNTMREKLITATKPTGQNYYRANPTGNELGTELAPIRSLAPPRGRDHKSTPATINYSALQNVDLKDITDLSGMSNLG